MFGDNWSLIEWIMSKITKQQKTFSSTWRRKDKAAQDNTNHKHVTGPSMELRAVQQFDKQNSVREFTLAQGHCIGGF